MTSFPRNGQFFQRRKMFIEAPFHNMKSYVPLDWSAEDGSTQELERIKIKQSLEQQSLRKVYNQQVDKRLQRRYAGYLQDLSKSRNEDILSREVEHFNHSKLNSGETQRDKREPQRDKREPQRDKREPQRDKREPQREKRETREMGLQFESTQSGEKEAESKSKPNNKPQPFLATQKEAKSRPPKENPPLYEYHSSNPETEERAAASNLKRYEQNYVPRVNQQNSSFARERNRYRSLEVQRTPYPKQNLSKLVEQLYTGTKVQQYPFRNVMPDKLENHLRQKTKADRKRTYEVTLNLFKH